VAKLVAKVLATRVAPLMPKIVGNPLMPKVVGNHLGLHIWLIWLVWFVYGFNTPIKYAFVQNYCSDSVITKQLWFGFGKNQNNQS
jgi:hypothetical protein